MHWWCVVSSLVTGISLLTVLAFLIASWRWSRACKLLKRDT